MLRSFQHLAREPDAPLKPLAANARDVVAWLQTAQVKLHTWDVSAYCGSNCAGRGGLRSI
jgi:hypothetical protein